MSIALTVGVGYFETGYLKTFFYFRLKKFRDFDTLLQITPYSPLLERIILRTMNYLCIT